MDEESSKSTLKAAIHSSQEFIRLLMFGSILLRRDRLGEAYNIHHSGHSIYTVFRETESRDGTTDPSTVLVVGFRLRFLGSNSLLHWLFQRICIISTPIWSSFRGFRTKLWMVDYGSRNYLGIYEWAGEQNALSYAEWLVNILRPLSTERSVWYEIYRNKELDEYLRVNSVVQQTYDHFSKLSLSSQTMTK